MPIFEFKCDQCGADFEELVFQSDEAVECPECGHPEVTKKPSAFAFKTDSGFTSSHGASCGGCTPGPGGCSSCKH